VLWFALILGAAVVAGMVAQATRRKAPSLQLSTLSLDKPLVDQIPQRCKRVADVVAGQRVILRGRVFATWPIGAPYSGRPCVAWQGGISKWSDLAGSTTIEMSGAGRFELEDASGARIAVDGRDHVDVHAPIDWEGHAMDAAFGKRTIANQEALAREGENLSLDPVGLAFAGVATALTPNEPRESASPAQEGIIIGEQQVELTGHAVMRDGALTIAGKLGSPLAIALLVKS